MNLLIDLLPTTVDIEGIEYEINSDFRTSILFELLMQDVEIEDEEPEASEDEASEEEEYFCPECNTRITADMTKCPHCGVEISFEEE